MKVDLLSVTGEPLSFKFRLEPDEIDLDTEGVRISGSIDVAGELSNNSAKTDVKVRSPPRSRSIARDA